MPFLISTIEDKLRFRLGSLLMDNEALQCEVDRLEQEIADMKASSTVTDPENTKA